MSAPAFDTLRFADDLKRADFAPAQAEALARAISQTLSDNSENVATRADLAALETRLDARLATLESRFDAKLADTTAKLIETTAKLIETTAKLETTLYRQHLTVLVSLIGLAVAIAGIVKFVK